uniref:carboxylesterase n=1 Tax=Glossina brevipalpis TaxID=37001 RepID=A0A1A9W1E4_9MUSC
MEYSCLLLRFSTTYLYVYDTNLGVVKHKLCTISVPYQGFQTEEIVTVTVKQLKRVGSPNPVISILLSSEGEQKKLRNKLILKAEIYVTLSVFDVIKLGSKFISHRLKQCYLTTNEYEIINTNYGRVKGVKRKTIYDQFYYAFEGIPYAKPPIGELRFRAPQPPEPWKHVLNCSSRRSKPMQKNFLLKFVEGSEDCLYLNVYTNKLNSEKPLPVMVWVYGGGFQIGEATCDIYAPDYFMVKDVVLVTFNYRLGVFGFLSFNDPDLDIPGNAGLKDQVMALRWVKDNIHNFSGDPNNTTVFGISSGAVSAHLLMLSEQARGLFHKAILQSGCALNTYLTTALVDRNYRLARTLGYRGNNNDLDIHRFLSKLRAKRLADPNTPLLNKSERLNQILTIFVPVVEPYETSQCIISKPYKDCLQETWSNQIPVVIGGTSYEGLLYKNVVHLYPFLIEELDNCSSLLMPETKTSQTPQEIQKMALELKTNYFKNTKLCLDQNLYEYLHLLSHRSFWHGIHRVILARRKYAPTAATYCYRFDFDSKFFNHVRLLKCGPRERGVCHADDLSYLFYNMIAKVLDTGSNEYRTIQRMVGMWYNFALNSDPNCPEIQPIKWETVQKDSELYKCLNINEELEFIELPDYNQLKLWDKFYEKVGLI